MVHRCLCHSSLIELAYCSKCALNLYSCRKCASSQSIYLFVYLRVLQFQSHYTKVRLFHKLFINVYVLRTSSRLKKKLTHFSLFLLLLYCNVYFQILFLIRCNLVLIHMTNCERTSINFDLRLLLIWKFRLPLFVSSFYRLVDRPLRVSVAI